MRYPTKVSEMKHPVQGDRYRTEIQRFIFCFAKIYNEEIKGVVKF